MSNLKALLIDLSGTLHVADTPTPGAADAINRLRQAKPPIQLRFVSNTSKESKQSLLEKMKQMDLDVREEELFTSLSAVASLVTKRNLNPLYLLTDSAATDFPSSSPPYDSVVVGLAPDQLNYAKLNDAFRLLSPEEKSTEDVPLVVTHKAKYFRDKDGGLSLGPGPFISALEEASGVEAEVVGKPTASFYQLALDSLDPSVPNGEVGMIGDDATQDVGPAVAKLGLQRFLVKTGKYREEDEDKVDPPVDWCGESFAVAVDCILEGR